MTLFIPHNRVAGSGPFRLGLAGEALGNRKVVYISDDGTWKLADADAATTMPSVGLTMHAVGSGGYGWILLFGFIGLSTWTWTVGGKLYVSEATAGELTQTAPSGSTEFVQELGVAETATQIFFSPRLTGAVGGGTYTKMHHVGVEAVRIPAAGAPDVVVQDNTVMLSFNQNGTEDSYFSWEVPPDYAGGDLGVYIHWTNDGGVDDNGKNIRFQLNYQSMTDGTVVSGNHANSPKTINDTYTSAAEWIMHTTDAATMAAADFSARHQITFRLTAIAAAATQLTGEVHLVAVMLCYTAYANPS